MALLYKDGIYVGDLAALIADINTKFIALLTQLVADTTVNTSTYLTGCTPGVLGSHLDGKSIAQDDVVLWLNRYATGWLAMLDLLDDDTGIAATDYEATYTITIPATITSTGVDQGALITTLNTIITYLNTCNAIFDADSLQLSDYASLFNVTDTVVE